ncbi:MAG: 1-acyl-sn-glycerol-3-phosphate acyltransferase, partial [Bifidobacterium crudilactis]|nr:1-acyl-sn-glycerol-3-phosphate acyltransferase [Bifidobacterium crudilactis]
MVSKGKPSPRSAVEPLSDVQMDRLRERHDLVDPTRYYPTGVHRPNAAEIAAQNP